MPVPSFKGGENLRFRFTIFRCDSVFLLIEGVTQIIYTLLKITCSPLKNAIPKGKFIFQPLIFRGYVSFREGNVPKHVQQESRIIHILMNIHNHKFEFVLKAYMYPRNRSIPQNYEDSKTTIFPEPLSINIHTKTKKKIWIRTPLPQPTNLHIP